MVERQIISTAERRGKKNPPYEHSGTAKGWGWFPGSIKSLTVGKVQGRQHGGKGFTQVYTTTDAKQ